MTQWTFLFMPESVHLQSQAWTERQAALAQEAQKILAGWTKNREADLATSSPQDHQSLGRDAPVARSCSCGPRASGSPHDHERAGGSRSK